MVIENVMYFVLGVLVAGLLALMVVPAVWNRAVRLTKKRIEAATPMTMAEFRADKDQLRAEFAVNTRRLEMNIEALRRRLADQLRDINRSRTELGGIKTEREQHQAVVQELEAREKELRNRTLELEKENTDLAQRLRMRERELAEKVSQLEAARAGLRAEPASPPVFDGAPLSGNYDTDIAELGGKIAAERARIAALEAQNSALLAQLENADRGAGTPREGPATLSDLPAAGDEAAPLPEEPLERAEARIADAERRIADLFAETDEQGGTGMPDMLLAEKLTLEDELARVRRMVADMEAAVLDGWADGGAQEDLRGRLDEIAAAVGQLAPALQGEEAPEEDGGQTLLDRVQRFIRGAEGPEPFEELPSEKGRVRDHAVSDRLKALRELQDGN
jgi:hypothetical protein